MDRNRPLDTVRDGRLKVTIWENTNDKGDVYHTMTPSKIYEDRDGKLQDSHSFSMGEGLRVAALIDDGRKIILDRQRDLNLDRSNERDSPSREGRNARFQNRSGRHNSGPGMER